MVCSCSALCNTSMSLFITATELHVYICMYLCLNTAHILHHLHNSLHLHKSIVTYASFARYTTVYTEQYLYIRCYLRNNFIPISITSNYNLIMK